MQSTSKHERAEFSSVRKSVLFLGAVMVAYILYVVLSGQFEEFTASLAGVDPLWVARGALCMVCYYLLGVVGYAVPVSRDRNSPLGFRDLMSAEAAGIFFSYLSPGGAGSAPARIYRLTRAGLSVGAASALQFTRYIIYEAAEGIFAAIMLIFRYQYFVEIVGNFAVIGLVLFGAKIIAVAGLIAFCVFPRFVRRIGNAGIRILEKTPLKLDYARWRDALNNQSQEFSQGFKESAREWKMMAFAVLVSMSQLACQYALGWFVAHAFGFHNADLVTCLAAGSMLELLTSAIPLPGGVPITLQPRRSSEARSPRRTWCGASSSTSARSRRRSRCWVCAAAAAATCTSASPPSSTRLPASGAACPGISIAVARAVSA